MGWEEWMGYEAVMILEEAGKDLMHMCLERKSMISEPTSHLVSRRSSLEQKPTDDVKVICARASRS